MIQKESKGKDAESVRRKRNSRGNHSKIPACRLQRVLTRQQEVFFLILICMAFFLINLNAKSKVVSNNPEQMNSSEEADKNNDDINFENTYFYSETGCLFSADIQYIEDETVTIINGELELQWLKEYDNGNLYKLMVEPDGRITGYLSKERLIIYFYVTSDKIYRLWSFAVRDGKLIEFYNNDALLMETLNTDEKLVKNGEVVCCMENMTDELEVSEVGKHVMIIQRGEQVIYDRVDINENGGRGFYERFVWEEGKGLIEYKSGYRMESEILYIDNIFIRSEK